MMVQEVMVMLIDVTARCHRLCYGRSFSLCTVQGVQNRPRSLSKDVFGDQARRCRIYPVDLDSANFDQNFGMCAMADTRHQRFHSSTANDLMQMSEVFSANH